MILLKDASLLQILAAYTLLIGHSEKEQTIIDIIIYTPISKNEMRILAILSKYKSSRGDILPMTLEETPSDITLLEAAQTKKYLLENALGHILCQYYDSSFDATLTYYLIGNGEFRISINNTLSPVHDAKEIMKELGYNNWRIYSH